MNYDCSSQNCLKDIVYPNYFIDIYGEVKKNGEFVAEENLHSRLFFVKSLNFAKYWKKTFTLCRNFR